MKITVIIPYRNAAVWLPRCLASLISQNGDFEFLLINDHSTDGSQDIVRAYPDSRIRMIDNIYANGVSGARNTGIVRATGEYITFLDADDKLNENAFYQMKHAALTGHCLIQLNHLRTYATGMTVCKWNNPEGFVRLPNVPLFYMPCWNKLIKADFIGSTRFDVRMQYAEDELFVLDLLAKTDGIYCSDVIAMTHFPNNVGSLFKQKKESDLWKEIEQLEKRIKVTYRDKPELKRVIMARLAESWSSKKFIDIIGGSTNG